MNHELSSSKRNEILSMAEYTHWWYQSRRAITEHIFFKKHSASDLKILSVGCGLGSELEHLSRFGKVTGVDADAEVVHYCKKKGLDVICADILKAELPEESFDVIVAMDVLEHIKEDTEAIKSLKRLLKKDGTLLLTVPALQCLWSVFDDMQGDFPHHRRYTKKNLTQLLEGEGFFIQKLSYYNFFLFPLAYLTRKLNRSYESQMLIKSNFKNRFLRSIFSFEKYFLKWMSFPIGVSLIGWCVKK